MLTHRKSQNGVTLIELMIGLAIVGILIAVAAPSFNSWIQNAQVRTAAQSILDGLQLARAEAVRSNAQVRFNLSSTTGLVDWDICSTAASPCPASSVVQSRSNTEGTVNARIGVYEQDDGLVHTNYATPVAAGSEMPTYVTFNGLGQVVTTGNNCNDAEFSRLDVTNAVYPAARRLVIEVSCPGGQVRMCDPSLSGSDPRGC